MSTEAKGDTKDYGGNWVNDREAAAYLGLKVQTLRNHRCLGRGPRFAKFEGRSVRYRMSDLRAYAEGFLKIVESGQRNES
jgi:hypothetical protein